MQRLSPSDSGRAIKSKEAQGQEDKGRWAFWIGGGSLAIIDQALIAVSNFVVNVLLARWLSPAEYGAYALAFAAFLLVSLVYQSLVLEPQRIFGATEHADHHGEYLGVLLSIHFGLTSATVLGLGVYAWITHLSQQPGGLQGAVVGVTVAGPCVLLLWLARGAFYTRMGPHGAVIGSGAYLVVVLLGIAFVYENHLLSPLSAFVVTAAGALVSSFVLLIVLKPVWPRQSTDVQWRKVLQEHWHYGRWIVVSAWLSWLTADMYYPLVSTFSGLNAAGQLRALQNFSLPITQASNALAVFILPYAAKVSAGQDTRALTRLTWKVSGIFAAGACAYWLVVLAVKGPALQYVYGSRYGDLSPMLILVAIASIPWTIAYVPAVTLRALRSSSSILLIYCVSGSIAVGVGIPMTKAFGLTGALWTMILSNASAFAAAFFLVAREIRTRSNGEWS